MRADAPQYHAPLTTPQNKPKDPDRGYIVAGWVGFFLFWPLAFVMSIILMVRGRLGHGITMFVLTVLWVMFFVPLVLGIGGTA